MINLILFPLIIGLFLIWIGHRKIGILKVYNANQFTYSIVVRHHKWNVTRIYLYNVFDNTMIKLPRFTKVLDKALMQQARDAIIQHRRPKP